MVHVFRNISINTLTSTNMMTMITSDVWICVNAVCPGTVETPSWHGRVNESEDPVQAKKDFIARQKMGRLGTAEEIANLVLYLSSDESSYTTGTCHVIDGGWSI